MVGHVQSEPDLHFARVFVNENTEKELFGFYHQQIKKNCFY
jgi:hypothetical protein